MFIVQHNRLLATLASAMKDLCIDGSVVLTSQIQRYSSDSSTSSSSSSSSSSSPQAGDVADEFQQRVAALQSGRPESHLQQLMKAGRAGSSSSSSQATVLHSRRAADSAAAAAADADAAPAEDGSSSSGSAASLFDARYGYAVLGGVDPEAAQQEAGAQQPKLHPSRDFRHGEVYEPTELSPLAREEAEAWLPRSNSRRGRRRQPLPQADLPRLDYKNVDLLLRLVSDSGRLLPRRATGLKPTQQARAARTVKLARQMALFPYEMRVGDSSVGDSWRRMREVEAAQQSARSR
uniref:Small ribosomal subunit protein bS18c n=1 Tax=Tetradesmus obliquus TaxID=3088 RepID=A0A383WBV7_TETOB|eukprot:jgi/Sobl393_1/182/SZX74921.1